MVKIERTFPAPPSLEIEAKKPSGAYNEPDVIQQLKTDFHNKCYICELKNLQDPEVEHLRPHKNGRYPERKFDWNNLFWSCRHCNGVKNKAIYDETILDCCKYNPEELIDFRLENGQLQVTAKDIQNEQAVHTASLVYETFNLKNTGMRVYTSEMRFQELTKEMNKLYDNLEEFKKDPSSKTVMRKLQSLLRKESAFAAFKRNYIREHQDQFPSLAVYVM